MAQRKSLSVWAAGLIVCGLAFCPAASRAADVKQSQTAGPAKAVQEAKVAVVKAREGVNKAKLKIEAQFKVKPEWIKAQQALDKANADLAAASRPAIEAARNKPEYLAASKTKATDKEQYNLLQLQPDPANRNAAEIDRLGTSIAQASTLMNQLERQAMENDPKVLDAKARVEQARQAMDALKAQVDEVAKADPECMAAQQAFEQAQATEKSARESLAQAAKAEADARAAEAKSKAEAAKSRSSSGGSSSGGGYKKR